MSKPSSAMAAVLLLMAGLVIGLVPAVQAQDRAREPRPSNPIDNNPLAAGAPFEAMRGLLPLPVRGRRLLDYGVPTASGGTSQGILFESPAGAFVSSPCEGWVIYADALESYGKVLVINAGDGYHIRMAGLGSFDVRVGDFVMAGDPVGALPRARQIAAEGQDRQGLLYLELRKDDQVIDAAAWWPRR
jgi:murein hydrolase activator